MTGYCANCGNTICTCNELEAIYNELRTVSELEVEKRNRIRLSVAAYAYEFENKSIISDAEFDKLCLDIKPEIETGNTVMDTFFKTEFAPHTGQWIHKHPYLEGIRSIYYKHGSKWK